MGFFLVEKIILATVLASLVLTSQAQLLPQEEVEVLEKISLNLQNKYWDYVNRSSCNGGFNYTKVATNVYSGIWCDCSFNSSTVCHVARIQMKGLNLTGTLPEEFVNLNHLQEIDLTQNYLNGSIPKFFGQLRLVNLGYIAPEYALRGYLTDKADVYSFGIVALEIVSGKSNTNYRPKEEFVYLLDWAYVLREQGNLLELVDPSLGSDYSKKEALRMLNLALLCANPSPTLRPSMSAVVSMLEGKIPVQVPLVKRGAMGEDIRFKAFEIAVY